MAFDAITMDETVRVFVGATPSEWLPTRVLEYSIRETTKRSVDFTALYKVNRAMPVPQALKNRPRTPFSFQRFLIPELCGFSNKAIYLDADMLVLHDIDELWSQPFAGCDLQTVESGTDGRRGQFSVMLLDCERLHWDIEDIVALLDAGVLNYAALMYEMRVAQRIGRDISPDWNSLERYDSEKTALLHYTDMPTQPWTSLANPLDHLWVSCLRRALAADFITRDELRREVVAGHIRPSLVSQVEAGVDLGLDVPGVIRSLDRGFVAPYHRLCSTHVLPWRRARDWAIAALHGLSTKGRRSS
jgi:hypothetical protein